MANQIDAGSEAVSTHIRSFEPQNAGNGIGATISGMADFSGKAHAAHRARHAAEFERIENPRTNEALVGCEVAVSSVRVNFTPADRRRAVRGSASGCLIAVAAKRSWGGDWAVARGGARYVSGDGKHAVRYSLTLRARAVMTLFDWGLPVPWRWAQLGRGRQVAPPVVRKRKRRRVAAVAFAAAVVLAGSDMAWEVVAVVGALAGVMSCVAIVAVRRNQPSATPRHTSVARPAATQTAQAWPHLTPTMRREPAPQASDAPLPLRKQQTTPRQHVVPAATPRPILAAQPEPSLVRAISGGSE